MGAAIPSTLKEALDLFQPVIGLEVHAQLLTRSKIFSTAPADYDPTTPNRFVNEYCFGLPGVLPVLNARAVEMAIRAGLALGCTIREKSIWSRKHYFYPDLPKGYQISQYDEPLCEHGKLGDVRVLRIHMEEDAGKSMHVEGTPYSLVDYNRAGFPLIEIVSEPDLRSAHDASAYLKELRSILMTLGVCDGNMEEGSFRCDANVSIQRHGATEFGTRCELKNINSFRFVEQAIEVEIVRQAKIVAAGGRIEQETRLFDSAKKETRSMRSKEEAHDYRYFPDPDLPPLVVDRAWVEQLRKGLPELPAAKRKRYLDTLKIPAEAAETFVHEAPLAAYFDQAVAASKGSALGIANLLKNVTIELSKITPEDLAELVKANEDGRISSSQVKKVLAELIEKQTPLAALLEKEGTQVDDTSVLEPLVDALVKNNPKEAAKLKGGQQNLIGFFVGQVMKATGGKAKPQVVRDLVMKKIAELP